MNIKYFGNSLDLMKFDILSYLLVESKMSLFYIPMLTFPQERVTDPKYLVYDVGTENEKLYQLMRSVYQTNNADFSLIADYFKDFGIEYRIILPSSMTGKHVFHVNSIEYFEDVSRERYFHQSLLRSQEVNKGKFIFIDPDVGCDINIKRRFRSKKDSYLKLSELKSCISISNPHDVVCFFQHLGNNRYPLVERLNDLKNELGEFVLIVGYKKILGALVFVFKNEVDYNNYRRNMENYMERYRNKENVNQIIIE